MGESQVHAGAPGRFPRRARDRRQDRDQRGHDDAGLLALLRPCQQIDRAARRFRRTRRAAVRHRSQRVRAGPQRPYHRRGRRREGAFAAPAGADRREAAARPAGDPRRRAEGPRAGAVGSRGGARRPALGRNRARRRAQPAAHPRPVRRRHRAAREDRPHRRRGHRVRADRRHDHPAQGRVGAVHQCRRQRSGLHGRQSLDGVADRQRARSPTRPR